MQSGGMQNTVCYLYLKASTLPFSLMEKWFLTRSGVYFLLFQRLVSCWWETLQETPDKLLERWIQPGSRIMCSLAECLVPLRMFNVDGQVSSLFVIYHRVYKPLWHHPLYNKLGNTSQIYQRTRNRALTGNRLRNTLPSSLDGKESHKGWAKANLNLMND